MTQSIQIRSFEDLINNPELLRQEIEDFPGTVLSAAKIRRRIVEKYGFLLDSHEEYSLSVRLSMILAQKRDNGEILVYRYSKNHPIKYARKRI